MNLINLQTTIKRNPELVSSDIDGEKVMMSLENGEYFGLDPVGSRIWELIENPISVDRLISLLLEEFEVGEAQCNSDTIEFLNQLQEKNLLIIIS
jgi:hypothetical protein